MPKLNNQPLISLVRTIKVPPYQESLTALSLLKENHRFQVGLVKQYHTEITDILRQYLDDQYNFGAAEMTTEEILETYDQSQLSRSARARLSQILTLADLVKFAKEQPLPNENDLSLDYAVEFVNETKPAVADKQENKNPDQLSEPISLENNNKISA